MINHLNISNNFNIFKSNLMRKVNFVCIVIIYDYLYLHYVYYKFIIYNINNVLMIVFFKSLF